MELCIRQLEKTYPNGTRALQQANLTLGPGLFGLLGPNGAGKSTLMRTVATLQRPDSGRIHFGDIDVLKQPHALRQVLGYLPQEFGVYPGVSAERLLHYFARLKGLSAKTTRHKVIEEVLELTNLTPHRQQAVHTFSGGMKRRFGIAQLLLNDPQLIIVDEPTAGLDPAERRHFLDVLSGLSAAKTVIFSTHIVEDVKALCPSFAIMHRGALLLHADTEQALCAIEQQVWEAELPDWQETQGTVLLSQSTRSARLKRYRVWSPQAPSPAFKPVQAELEDLYFFHLKKQ